MPPDLQKHIRYPGDPFLIHARAGAQAHDHRGDINPGSPGGAGGDRLLHGGGPHASRTGDLRRAVFIHLESRKVDIAGITVHPNERWMQQMARNVTMEGCGTLQDCRYLLHDRDTKYTISFRAIIESGGVKTLPLPARSPNLNAYAERWVKSVKDECLSKIILFGERSLRRALSEYVEHYHAMLSGIIKGSLTSCCSVGSRKGVVGSMCNVAR